MLRKCQNHGFDELTLIHIFRNGLLQQSKLLMDATTGGSLLSLSAADATAIIEKMALSDHQGDYNRNPSQRKPGVIELGTGDAVLAQNKLISQSLEEITKQLSKLPQQFKEMQELPGKAKQIAYCELCSGDHQTGYFPPHGEEVNYMGNHNQQKQVPYQNNAGYQRGGNSNYNQGWRQDVGSSNRQRQYESFNQPQPLPQQNQNSNLEETMSKFMEMQIQYNQQQQKFQQETQVYQRGNDAVLRNLETQIVQIAKQVANNNNQGGSFSANTETNPKEQCKSITTRSGKEIGKGIGDNLRTEESVVEAREEQEERMEESEKDAGEKNNEEELVEKEKYQKNEKNKKMNEEEYKGEVSEERKAEVQKARNEKSIKKSPPIQHLPYPHAQSKKDKER
jgi:hypothetical protein